METLAQHFDLPETSPEHRLLAETAWMGGELVSVRYYLGRLLKRNLFRESHEEVNRCLRTWVAQRTSEAGAVLIRGPGTWQIPDAILRREFEIETNRRPTGRPREIAAVVQFLTTPTISLADLAKKVRTTEKQLKRMSLLNYAQILMRRALGNERQE
jgi:hypothetical protein